jgi:ABC-type polysaccharide/polyol phosphate transport system ATPase subunit
MCAHISGVQTLVFLSHSERQLETLWDRCALIDHGVRQAVGPIEAAMERYRAR